MKNVAKWSKSDFKCSSFPLKNCGELALSVVSILRQSLKGKPWNWVMVLQYCYFTLDVGVKYRVRSVWVSVHSSQKPHVQISPNILFVLPMVVAQFSSGRKAIHCVLCKGVMVSPKTKLILSRTWSQCWTWLIFRIGTLIGIVWSMALDCHKFITLSTHLCL